MANVIPFRKPDRDPDEDGAIRSDDADHGDDHGTELAIIEPSQVELAPGSWQTLTLGRPTWAGTKARAARGWSLTWRWLAWQFFVVTPTRLFHVTKWLSIGLTWGLVDLARWVYAGDERKEDKTGTGRTRKGAAVKGGREADHLAWWRFGTVVVPPIAAWLILWQWLVNDPGVLPVWMSDYPQLQFVWAVPYLVWACVYGKSKSTKPYVPPAAPRARADTTAVAMVAVLRSNGILKPEPKTAGTPAPGVVTQARMPQQLELATRTVWDLPSDCGKSALDVISLRERLAGAFATPLDQFHIRPGYHPAQFEILQFKRDPFGGPMPIHPLAEVPVWDVWDGLPFGVGVLGDVEVMGLVFTSSLTGARPRRGKSFAARSKLVGAVLDPHVRWHVFNGKAGDTWSAVQPFSEHYVAGADEDQVAEVARTLEWLVREMRAQHARIKGSKLTRAQARDPRGGTPVRVVLVDEAQEYLSDPTYGSRIEAALVTLAKVGPSAGFCLELITQRPDEKSFPTTLRAVMGARYCLQVMSYHDSNVVLGPDMSKLGFDASKIRHKGVGYLRPDEDANGQADSPESCRLIRTFGIGEDEHSPGGEETWQAVCARGAALRAELAGQVAELPPAEADGDGSESEGAGDEMLPATGILSRFRRHAPSKLPGHVADADSLGMWLSNDHGIRAGKDRRGNRLRSLRAVERAVGLPSGCLSGAVRPAVTDDDGTPGRHPTAPDDGTP